MQIAGAGAVLAGVAGRSGSSFGASLGITDFLKLASGQNAVALLDTGGQAGGCPGKRRSPVELAGHGRPNRSRHRER